MSRASLPRAAASLHLATAPLHPAPGSQPDAVSSPDAGHELVALADAIRRACVARRLTVATAESCTGGLVSHALTEIAGSSAYYRGGVIAYANDVKVALLGVNEDELGVAGAVSAEVAMAMARGARERVGADLAVAVTGIAGPDGGTPTKPVGLTYVAVSGPAGTEVRECRWQGGRRSNKRESADVALRMLLTAVEAVEAIEAPVGGAAPDAGPGSTAY